MVYGGWFLNIRKETVLLFLLFIFITSPKTKLQAQDKSTKLQHQGIIFFVKKNTKNTRATPEVTMPIFFFLHSGNTNATKFCICAQDDYTSLYKKFCMNSTSFKRV